jgi:GNAT superfamily N-acetyltransferase
VEAGETWLALSDAALIGTITVDYDDPAWSDLPGNAAYVHRLSVPMHGTGLGGNLLAWAAGEAAAIGRDRLRLDCLASNSRLCRYYADLGFRPRGMVVVGGSPGQRDSSADAAQTVVRRFERNISGVAPAAEDRAVT